MTTSIVLIPVDHISARKTCELIQNQIYNSVNDLMVTILHELDGENYGVLIYDLSDFMDEVNDQNLDVLTSYFISYVQFKN